MDIPVLSLHVDDQLPPIGVFAEICDALRDLVAALSEGAGSSDSPTWALYEIEHEWDGTTVDMYAAVEQAEQGVCAISAITDGWFDLARRLAQDEPTECSAPAAAAVGRLRHIQREQGWTLRFSHHCQCCRRPAVIVPPFPVRLAARHGTIRGPVQLAHAGATLQLTVLDQATASSVHCYLSPDQGRVAEDAKGKFATVTGTILEDVDRGSPIAVCEIGSVELTPWDWEPLRDAAGMGRWDVRDEAAARLIHERRQSA